MSGFRSRKHLLLATIAISVVGFASCDSQNSQINSAPSPSTTANNSSSTVSPATAAPAAKLNINTASSPELLSKIPNLGNRMVREFEEYRPYRSIQQFRREIGKYVDPEQIAEYEKYIFVPINPNESDLQTLQQIPGLDETEAQSLVAGRPYASADAFLTKLSDKVSAQELEVARTYLSTQ